MANSRCPQISLSFQAGSPPGWSCKRIGAAFSRSTSGTGFDIGTSRSPAILQPASFGHTPIASYLRYEPHIDEFPDQLDQRLREDDDGQYRRCAGDGKREGQYDQ